MPELQAEIVVRLMSDGKVSAKWTPIGPLFLYGLLDMTRDLIREQHAKQQAGKRITEASVSDLNPRIPLEDIPPMMGNGK